MRGSPIRTSSDLSSVGSSPRLIAASHVLHRLLMPRHPPCALNNLATKMLASTVQFSRYGRSRSPLPSRTALAPKCEGRRSTDERSERAPLPQDPTACLRPRHLPSIRSHLRRGCTRRGSRCHGRTGQRSTHEHQAGMHIRHWLWTTSRGRQVLLRKEVIQPHLPVRLPCYDFVPIADPTFDGSLHKGWATGFGCYRLS